MQRPRICCNCLAACLQLNKTGIALSEIRCINATARDMLQLPTANCLLLIKKGIVLSEIRCINATARDMLQLPGLLPPAYCLLLTALD